MRNKTAATLLGCPLLLAFACKTDSAPAAKPTDPGTTVTPPLEKPMFDPVAEAAVLMQRSRDWSNAVERGELDAALAYWSDDAVLMAPGLPPLRGKQAIGEYVAGAAKIPGFAIRWEPLEAHVSASGDMAYLLERNEISMNDASGKTVTEHNKSVTVWTKQPDGSWKNVVDIWNGAPAPSPSP